MIKSYTTTVTLVVLCAILMANVALCDLYMHNPRGSINRNCERDANRRNANRLFDSQDNAAGGYACPRQVGGPEVKTPKMYYYEGSELYLEWTSQHSCGEHNNYCELVIQYMCNDTVVGNHPVYGDFYAVRDGIPNDGNDDATETVSEATKDQLRFGVHEQFENYFKCDKRRRNAGLYIADRNIGSRATSTRQNNNAERFGFECTEERDYYPYWHNSPWVDIAIFTTNTSMCSWYQENSQNVAPRGECWDAGKKNYLEFNNIRDCTDNAKTNIWVETPAWNVAPPECLSASLIAARDNYLGNSVDGEHARYKWTIPFIEKMPYDSVAKKTHHENCVLRMRYNITTTETPFFMDYKYNYRVGDKTSATPIRQDPWETFGYKSDLHLAVNTNQYGRTFEDRSYVFEIRERPATVPKWVTIHNLNVRGKRGNIVNVFPSVEYDFVPSTLNVNAGSDLVHFQWTGSDYNPNRTPNNAEGGPKDPAQNGYRADRSNIVQMDVAGLNTPRRFSGITMFLKEDGTVDSDLVHKLAFLGQNIADNVTSCLSKTALMDKNGQNTANAELDNNNCGKLANTPYGPYFDGGLVKMWASGKFFYMCTRNNNFSNRGQKAIMIVNGGKFSAAPAVAPSSMTTWMVALCSVLILTFNMLF